jgi:hypothetical protein
MIAHVNESLRNCLEYLISKYPPSRHKIADSELSKHITEVKRHADVQYETLKNAGVSFVDDTGKEDFSREIKIWINKLIRELRSIFPKFKNDMRTLFRGQEGSSLGEDED